MANFKGLFLLLFISLKSYSQYSFTEAQSTPMNWKTIENERAQVIYPENYKERAIYMANLIEYYSKYVGLSYGVNAPKQITLIYRPEMANPNGFVTLGPRRTEWFDSAQFSSRLSTLEWHEMLSIHEYRHVIQQDIFNKKTVKAIDVLMGDTGQQILNFVARKPWYMEGDAVYAETKYTPAGRGRSPRFMSRLKALLLKGETPTYDQFVGGSYNDELVNWYIYGYALISYGYKKYGDNFWNEVMDNVTARPYPNGIVGAIENASGIDFYDFYYAAFDELRAQWKDDKFENLPVADYKVQTNQYKNNENLYYLEYDLDNHFRLIKETKGEKDVLTDLPYSEDFTRLSYSEKYAIQSQFLPHWRYGFKGYSDLSLIDLEDGSKKYITSGERLYNPHFNLDGSKITAINFDKNGKWIIQELDLEGKKLRSIESNKYDYLEAISLNNNDVVAIVTGQGKGKAIVKTSFNNKSVKELIPLTYNNLYALNYDGKDSILFEAQYKGKIEIFKLNVKSSLLEKCTTSKIASYSPSFSQGQLYFTEQTINGKRIRNQSFNSCQRISINALVDRKQYYAKNDPSDSYNNFKLVDIKNRDLIHTKNASNYKEEDYSGFDWRTATPHSWSFFVGTGYGLNLFADNYLRDFSWNVSLGYEAAENTPYSSAQVNFKRYWPILSATVDLRERMVSQLSNDTDDYGWDEVAYGAQIELPIVKRRNLYNFNLSLAYKAEQVLTDDYIQFDTKVSGEADFIRQSSVLSMFLYKDMTARSILSPWSLSLTGMYQDAKTDDDTGLSGDYRWFGDMAITTPGFFTNNGIKFTFSGEQYGNGNNYRFQPSSDEFMGYTYSRGYDYFAAKKYLKSTVNYLFPLFYPDYNISAFIYFKRIYMNLYYDITKAKVSDLSKSIQLSSYGTEIIFNTNILRAFPVDFGLRYINKHEAEKEEFEGYLGTSLDF
ncbi:hypothetical protein ACRXCV_14640 [Halobacteriovorax sp. GFR7]|uniref:hypothetical protein n=1 Tax=unclassified Halobacteriovorax TaxID=2639665 RepID=UPI003D99B9D1